VYVSEISNDRIQVFKTNSVLTALKEIFRNISSGN